MDGVALHQNRLEALNAHAVQRRGPVQQHGVVLDHGLEDVPDLLVLPLEHLLRALDRVRMPQFLQLADDERLVEFQRDLLRQTALVQFQVGADHDHAAGRVVDAFAEQVFAKPALLPLDHVRQRLQGPIAAAQHGSLAAVVVEQGIDRLLQHAFLVADDDLRGVEVDEFPQPVVAVDDPAVEVVQIAGGEIARIQQHQRAQIGRDHGDHVQDHPLRPIVAVADRLDDLEAVDQVLLFLFGVGFDEFLAQLLGELHQIQTDQQLADGFRPHVGLEAPFAPLLACRAEFFLGQQLLPLEVRVSRVDHNVVLEVDHLFQAGGLHVQQVPQAAGHGLEEPDVDHRRRQFDMPHPLAADARVGDLDAAAIADHALVFHAAILAAGAFPVLFRAEDAFAEQAVLFGPVGAVVDRFGLLHLAEGPAPDVVRACQTDLDRGIIIDPIVRAFADGHLRVLPEKGHRSVVNG